MFSIQDSNFSKALATLDSLAARADLTGQQQKVVNDLIAQVRKKLATTGTNPAP